MKRALLPCLFIVCFSSACRQAESLTDSVNKSLQDAIGLETLHSTGLYNTQGSNEVSDQVENYQPQYPLWTDGADKNRWIDLPEDSQINTLDMNRWVFPVGTKIWKEFSFDGKRVETRLIEKVGEAAELNSWVFKTYQWNDEETEALRAPTSGVLDAAETAHGTTHDIPGENQCKSCHNQGGDVVLSFDATQLAGAGVGLRLADLIAQELITDIPAEEPQIPARNETEQFVFGYLHANCGSCHNPMASAGSITGLHLRHEIGGVVEDLPAFQTTVDALTRYFQVPDRQLGVDSFRVESGSPASSALVIRNSMRGGYPQMPPLGTKVVDEMALEKIKQWVEHL